MALILPRSVFFHVPKTGGVWVRGAIARAGIPTVESGGNPGDPAMLHQTLRTVDTGGRFTFTFVRHPLRWYASFWAYRMEWGWRNQDPLDSCLCADFPAFIRRVLRRFPKGHLSDRYDLYVGPPGLMSFVGRTENLVEDLVAALREAGEEFDEEDLRKTPRANETRLRPVYPEDLHAALLKAEERALVRFGYTR